MLGINKSATDDDSLPLHGNKVAPTGYGTGLEPVPACELSQAASGVKWGDTVDGMLVHHWAHMHTQTHTKGIAGMPGHLTGAFAL